MKPVRIHPEAGAELDEGVAWYAERSLEAASALIDEVDRAISALPDFPKRFTPILQTRDGIEIRQAPVKRFPFAIVYAELANDLVVIALAHLKRRPLYWVTRVDSL